MTTLLSPGTLTPQQGRYRLLGRSPPTSSMQTTADGGVEFRSSQKMPEVVRWFEAGEVLPQAPEGWTKASWVLWQ